MGKFVNSVDEFFSFCKENDVQFVDFRFTDMKGTWHHVSYRMSAVNAGQFEGGFRLTVLLSMHGSRSISSDMLLKPDAQSAFMDPFTADPTIIVFCDVYDIYKGQAYEKCPRSIAKKALEHLANAGVGDVAYFGPENEFFVFDDVKIRDEVNCSVL